MSCQMVAHASGERHSLAKSSGRIKPGRKCWHLRTTSSSEFCLACCCRKVEWRYEVTGEGVKPCKVAAEGQDIGGPGIWLLESAILSLSLFPGLPTSLGDDASCKYLPRNSLLLFGLSWVFFPTTSPSASPPLVVGHHAFHYCLGKWKSSPPFTL